ncbi:hypothetical protein ScPMuIL_016361 [Solemya velum]
MDNYDYMMTEFSDKRTVNWFLMSSPLPTLITVGSYLLIVYWGQHWMKSRPAMELKSIIIAYNFCLVLLSTYIFWEFFISAWVCTGFSLTCESVNYSDDPLPRRLAGACWWFFFSKLVELLDTVFFILRKKNNQISFLHVYHHSTMPLLWWVGVRFVPGGEAYFSASINCFIHVLMYTYYLLSAMGPSMQKYLWWKKYMTTLQLVQFWAILFHTFNAIRVDCGFPNGYNYALIIYDLSHIFLFSHFYYQTYYTKKRVQSKSAQNGVVQNGIKHHTKEE